MTESAASSSLLIPVVRVPRGAVVWRCVAMDRRSGEVISGVEVVARSASEARRLARMRLPNYARIVCEEAGPVMIE